MPHQVSAFASLSLHSFCTPSFYIRFLIVRTAIMHHMWRSALLCMALVLLLGSVNLRSICVCLMMSWLPAGPTAISSSILQLHVIGIPLPCWQCALFLAVSVLYYPACCCSCLLDAC